MFDIPTIESLNLSAALPVLLLTAVAVILLVVDLFIPQERKHLTAWLAMLGVLVSLAISVNNLNTFTEPGQAFGGMLVADQFTNFINIIILLTAALGILLAMDYLRRTGMNRSEFYLLLLFTTCGMMFMASANDLIIIFVSLELLSIPLYVLCGFRRPELKSEESALKYFLLGAFASGFLVYGIAMIYGATGTTRLPEIWAAVGVILETGAAAQYLLMLGAGLITVGLGFKVAAVPFHMWTPDVYEGAPTPVTAFMSVGAKAGGFAALLRVLVVGLPTLLLADATAAAWQDAIALIAGLTLILGNVVAIMQTNIKRMLAYSSIAHAGYILIAVSAAGNPAVGDQGVQAALIYLLTYAFTNLGAFAIAIAIERDDGSGVSLDDFKGLFHKRPGLAMLMAFFMLSLTGIPLTAGFVGKWYVFWSAINAGLGFLAVVGVLLSVVGAFYYVRVIVKMFLEEGEADIASERVGLPLNLALLVTGLGTLLIGILPMLVADMAQGVTIALGGG